MPATSPEAPPEAPPEAQPEAPPEAQPTTAHEAAEAAASTRVPDPARGGPPMHRDASPLPPFLHVSRETATYLGTASCASCHTAAAATWTGTRHATSVQTLEQAERAFDPGCLRCHVTGLGHPGGWASHSGPVPLGSVSCEACHGPGSDHIHDTSAPYGGLPGNTSACVACHSHDSSPDFSWSAYWPAVAHGTEAADHR